LKSDAIFWTASPKKSAGVPTDLVRMSGDGKSIHSGSPWQPVMAISIDETWSGTRYKFAPNLESERQDRATEEIRDSDGTLVVDRVNRVVHPPKDFAAISREASRSSAIFQWPIVYEPARIRHLDCRIEKGGDARETADSGAGENRVRQEEPFRKVNSTISPKTKFRIIIAIAVAVIFIAVFGGIALLATLAGSFITLIAVPVFWFRRRRRAALMLLGGWGIYLALYAVVSTGMAVMRRSSGDGLSLGQEFCADAGCFAVDKIDKADDGQEIAFALSWRLVSTDKLTARRFPGKGLEFFMFDDRGRKFPLPRDANQDPLDVLLPAGGTVRETMTFRVPKRHGLFSSPRNIVLTHFRACCRANYRCCLMPRKTDADSVANGYMLPSSAEGPYMEGTGTLSSRR
jgi:hypothetical protein